MPLPEKRWFRIADVAKRWEIPPSDIEDYALDEMLRLFVFVVDLPAEAGICERDDHTHHHILEDMPILNGPQPLCRASLLSIFRDGRGRGRQLPHGATGRLPPSSVPRTPADRSSRRSDCDP